MENIEVKQLIEQVLNMGWSFRTKNLHQERENGGDDPPYYDELMCSNCWINLIPSLQSI